MNNRHVSHDMHPFPTPAGTLKDRLARYERRVIQSALTTHRGNTTLAAWALGISPASLLLKLGRARGTPPVSAPRKTTTGRQTRPPSLLTGLLRQSAATLITQHLHEHQGNVSAVARALGCQRKRIYATLLRARREMAR